MPTPVKARSRTKKVKRKARGLSCFYSSAPNGITSTRSYEPNRNLLTSIVDTKNGTPLSNKAYSYDAIARPTTRQINERSDSFAYNSKSELTAAQLGTDNYGYDYDNIGNRKTAQEIAEKITYSTNSTNEYTAVNDFTPEFDADGNQTRLQTSIGIWTVEYNAENRPTKFTSEDGNTIVEATYDYMGRRAWKKVTTNGAITKHERYLYRGYLQIACIDLTRSTLNGLYYLIWDLSEPTATRPLALQRYGSWFTFGLDISKNVKELFNPSGSVTTTYDYSPFGAVSSVGSKKSPLQWSSEIADEELGLVYYNYRHYNPQDGRWINRDPIGIKGGLNLYGFLRNMIHKIDSKGTMELKECERLVNATTNNPGAYSANMRKLIEYLNNQNCMPTITCVCETYADEDDDGGYGLGVYYISRAIELVVDNLSNAQDLLETLVHELIHARQHCDTGELSDVCDTILCEDMQAYRESGECQRQSPGNVRQCVINGAANSSYGNGTCRRDLAYLRTKAASMYESCYANYGNPYL